MSEVQSINVLDHGLVRLVSCMQPIDRHTEWDYTGTIQEDWTGDLEVVRNARTSYDAAWRAGEDAGKDSKLIHRLDRERHTSPFESMVFTFEVRAPIFVLRQWHRHRTWAYSEISARYAELPEVFYIPEAEHVGTQSKHDKQMRDIAEGAGISDADLWFIRDLQKHSVDGFLHYKKHIAAGVPRELARLFLGLNTYSHMFATVNLHNLLGFLMLRLDSHSQYEIRVFAEALLKLIEPIVPESVRAFKLRQALRLLPSEREELLELRHRMAGLQK